MSAHHFVEIAGDAGDIEASFICEAPPGSPCRMIPACDCEEWHSEECVDTFPDGPPMKTVNYCNPKEFIDVEGAEWAASGGKVRVPVTVEWEGETYTYDFDGDKP